MQLPNGGKVVIVDDNINEVIPLINILSSQNIPILYYDGNINRLPDKPLSGVRVVFLDLRFGSVIETKTIVSNACAVLGRIIDDENGPFLLIIWSSTGSEYQTELEKKLTKIDPIKKSQLKKSNNNDIIKSRLF